MKLSEQIRLGSLVLPGMDGEYFHFGENRQPNAGCALGMAAFSMGARTSSEAIEFLKGIALLEDRLERPCDCIRKSEQPVKIFEVIIHLFDFHVCFVCDWTLDRLIAWVESIEPQEIAAPVNQEAEQVAP
jgi:hypothetical protein